MNLLAFDPYANPSLAASANVEIVDSVDELLEQADFLTLHTPLIASTRGMIGDTELAKMKPTARILNVARGGMIDETALLSALEAGTIAGAGIDVFTAEPPVEGDAASKLIAHPKVRARLKHKRTCRSTSAHKYCQSSPDNCHAVRVRHIDW
jgi:D-3-phosphoglycerate dehydrogenase